MPIAEAFERHGEEAFRAARGGGRRRAAARRRTAARSPSAAAACSPSGFARPLGRHIVVWLQVDADGGLAADRGQRPAAGAQRRGRGRRCSTCACRCTRSWPTRCVPQGDRRSDRAGAAVDPGADRAAVRDEAALGGERLGRVPGLRRRAACSGTDWWPLRGPALLRHRHGRRRALRGSDRAAGGAGRGRARRGGEDDGRGRARC